jgi:hypothetical protein
VTTYLWIALVAVVAPAVLGLGIVRWLGVGGAEGRRLLLGLGYVVGHFALAGLTLPWLLLGRPVPGVLLPVVAAAVGGLLLRAARRRDGPPVARPSTPWWSLVPLALLLFCLADACAAKNAEPIRLTDEATNWAAKAKALWAVPVCDLHTALHFFVEHPDYPLLNPLVQALAFAGAGELLHAENRLPVQGFAAALLLLLSAGLSRRARPWVGALALVAFGSAGAFTRLAPTAYADVMLACCTLAAAEALLRWREGGGSGFLGVAAIAVGAMIQTKNEGLLLAAALLLPFAVSCLLARRRGAGPALAWRSLPWLLVPAASYAVHQGMNAWFGIQNDLTNPAIGQGRGLLSRVVDQFAANAGPVLEHHGRLLLDAADNRLLPFAFVIAAPLAAIAWRRQWLQDAGPLLLAAFALAMAGYMAVYIGTPYDLAWHLGVAADRTLLHVLPLAALGVGVALAPLDDAAATEGARSRTR